MTKLELCPKKLNFGTRLYLRDKRTFLLKQSAQDEVGTYACSCCLWAHFCGLDLECGGSRWFTPPDRHTDLYCFPIRPFDITLGVNMPTYSKTNIAQFLKHHLDY